VAVKVEMHEDAAMEGIAAKFGHVIRANRERRGLSQEALAALAGLNRNYLGEIERGTSVPSVVILQKLADALAEKLSTLMSECEQLDD
jgi:transcriptional regulator with XRE-family HTH domain